MPVPPETSAPAISAEEQRRIEAEQKYQHLIGQLNKHTGQLPADIETVVHEEKKKGKQDNKKLLHSAVTVLDKAQMKMDRAVNARNNLMASWRAFLAASLKQWKEYADQFQKQENECQEEITKAKEELIEAKKELAAKVPDEAEEISEDETEREETAKTAATRILGGLQHMSKSLSTLSAQAEKEQKEEEERQKKRQRKSSASEDNMEDATEEPVANSTGSLLPSMQPFSQAWPTMTIGYVDRQAQINAEVLIRNWNHSAVYESWFTTTWEASAKALRLHFELNPFSFNVPAQHCLGLPVPKRRAHLGLKVQFADQGEVAIESRGQNSWLCQKMATVDIPAFLASVKSHGLHEHRLDETEQPNLPDPPSSSDEAPTPGRPRRVPLRFLPAWVESLWNVLQDEGATEVLEEGPVIYLSTYYLSHRNCIRQAVSRPIRLNRRYEEWVEEFKNVWGDLYDRHAGYELFLVDPEPPISLTRGISGIVLIVQHADPGGAAVLTTALR